MRVHKLTFATLAVAASFSLTACQNGDDGAAQGSPSSAASASSASTVSPSGGASVSGGAEAGTAKPSTGTSSDGKGTAAGTGSTDSGKSGTCKTDELTITAMDSTIGGDAEGTVAVTLKNRGNRDCTLPGYAGVDLKTASGTLSAQRTGEKTEPSILKKATSVSFGVTYPFNTSGSGVRITGLVVTPPGETKSVTLAWPGAATLPVTDGSGAPVKVGPMGSAGQGG
ncbi:DUF4232 domain-containing protein [Streptomyces sp. NPDC087917]|uniref:DUF4232 domain-containing protein n=1 Tax=unclassified Streptomyces TaxID=2593676 RepID=UPI0034396812